MTNKSPVWMALIKTAVAGTGRAPLSLPDAGGALGDALRGITGGSPERRLLDAAALVGQYQRTGADGSAQPAPTLPDPCPPDTLPRCPEAVASRLEAMLGGVRRDVLPEWLAMAASRNWRVPEESLPRLLDAGQKLGRPVLLAQVIGERGRWLAGLNPAWQEAAYRLPESGEAIRQRWQLESLASRGLMLSHLRRSDPALARELLRSTWGEEDGETREVLITALGLNTSLDDEPFLEEALDDRRKTVRSFAAETLSCLPGSRLRARMKERARGVVVAHKKALGRLSLEVTPPKSCDAAMQRDGIDLKPPPGMGEQAHWITRLACLTDLGDWQELTSLPADKLVALADKTEWSEALVSGWQSAALLQKNEAWAKALFLKEGGDRDPRQFGLLPQTLQKEELLKQAGDADLRELTSFVEASGVNWDAQSSLELVQKIAHKFRGQSSTFWNLVGLFNLLGVRLTPTGEILAVLEGEEKAHTDQANQQGNQEKSLPGNLREILAFRHQMWREFGQ